MEGSRRGKENREKGLPTPDPHVDGGNRVKTIVYNTKKEEKKRGWKKNRLEKKERTKRVEEIQQQKERI